MTLPTVPQAFARRAFHLARCAASVLLLLLTAQSHADAQIAVPAPTADPAIPNVFYGPVPDAPPGSAPAPVIVFIHGLHGTASNWWVNNTMHERMVRAGYRTAYVSLSADNSPNDAGIAPNATMLRQLLPAIAQHFGVSKMYAVAHSKGGVDLQSAMLTPSIASLFRAVFTVATPNRGTELADWAFGPGAGIAAGLGLMTPGVYALRTASMETFRQSADPVLRASGVPFYTIEGKAYLGDPVTALAGAVLRNLNPNPNDGLVAMNRALLPADYATDLGGVLANHFSINSGDNSFALIAAILRQLETAASQFERLEGAGFGDDHNTWMWSVEWFKGKLYIGTGREVQCISFVNSDAAHQTGNLKIYPLAVAGGGCPDGKTLASSIAAEIWRFDPDTREWQRVFKSPDTIFLGIGPDGQPWYTARDVGFRGMLAFLEKDGTEALYVGGVTSGSMYDGLPEFAANGYPPPRLLRSVDGETFTPVPQTAGTFLGNIGNPQPGSQRAMRSFRGLTAYNGRLFATVGDYRGVGFVIASDDPGAGDDAWYRASPIFEEMPVWNITVFNDYLYAVTGDRHFQGDQGYGVYKTNASGNAPYAWQPVVVSGAYAAAAVRSPNGLTFATFKGQLYVGTDRPTELIRINPDDSWDLIAGEPRQTPQGFKAPLSGLGVGLGSWFNGHFWRMAVHEDELYLTTWDWSTGLRQFGIPLLDQPFASYFGFDMYRSPDGVHWSAVTNSGMGDPANSGGRSLKSTPIGLVLGTVKGKGRAEVLLCKTRSCAPEDPGRLPPPNNLEAVPYTVSGNTATLSWEGVPGAIRYRVYRATMRAVMDYVPANLTIPLPGLGMNVTIDDIRNGALDFLCPVPDPGNPLCIVLQAIKGGPASPLSVIGLPMPYTIVGITGDTSYSEPAPTALQSLYYVVAEAADGRLSAPSNFVGAPSKAHADRTPPVLTPSISPEPNAEGWNRGPLTVSWSVSDPESGIVTTTCSPVQIAADTAGTEVSCSAANGAGIRATQSVVVKIDSVAPVLSWSTNVQANQAGWFKTDVTVSFGATDGLSGIASVSAPVLVTTEGQGQRVVGSAADRAGNTAQISVLVNVDKTAPEATLRFDPATKDFSVRAVDALSGASGGAQAPVARALVTWTPAGASCGDGDENEDGDRRRQVAPGERRTYLLQDAAGNQLRLVATVRRLQSATQARVQSLQYNAGPVRSLTANCLTALWTMSRSAGTATGFSHVIQKARLRCGERPDAIAIWTQVSGKTSVLQVSSTSPKWWSGLYLLQFETASGVLRLGGVLQQY